MEIVIAILLAAIVIRLHVGIRHICRNQVNAAGNARNDVYGLILLLRGIKGVGIEQVDLLTGIKSAIQSHAGDVDNLTDSIWDVGLKLREVTEELRLNRPKPDTDISTHEGRVNLALNTPAVVNALKEGKYILAIKELRAAVMATAKAAGNNDSLVWGLKACKEAMDDPRVIIHRPQQWAAEWSPNTRW